MRPRNIHKYSFCFPKSVSVKKMSLQFFPLSVNFPIHFRIIPLSVNLQSFGSGEHLEPKRGDLVAAAQVEGAQRRCAVQLLCKALNAHVADFHAPDCIFAKLEQV